MGLALMGIVVQAGSFSLRDIVAARKDCGTYFLQFLGFCLFMIAGIAVTHRHPFDQPEAEQELADGYHVEYSGMKWGMFFVGEYVGVVMVSAMIVTPVLWWLACPFARLYSGLFGLPVRPPFSS